MNNTQLAALRKPTKLIENRIQFAGPDSEVSIYDTYKAADRVGLDADQLLYCGMITGRKIMHSNHHPDQTFLPHESFVMAPGSSVEIDFPDATRDSPTSCLTVEISKDKVCKVVDFMNHQFPLDYQDHDWTYDPKVLHTHHAKSTQQLLSRIVGLFTENHTDRDALIDLNIQELVIRLLRKKERDFLLAYCMSEPDANSCTAALTWMKENLSKPLNIDELCRRACMSRSRLYAEFKNKLGCSPVELQQQMRLKEAATRLQHGEVITTVCYDLGFSSPSHFCRRFKNSFGCTPTDYQTKHKNILMQNVRY